MKRLNTILSALVVAVLFVPNAQTINAQGSADVPEGVRIGTQVWSVTNLDVSRFRNGDPIPEAKTDAAWVSAFDNFQPAWSYYQNDPVYGTHQGMSTEDSRARGKLYNWFAVTDPRGLAPAGWHVPSIEEWGTLTVFLGGQGGPAETAMMVVKAQPEPAGPAQTRGGRARPDSGAANAESQPPPGGTNSSGFTGLPGGIRGTQGGFTGYGAYAYWWSSTKFDTGLPSFLAWYHMLSFFPQNSTPADALTSPTSSWGSGLSVRVVRD